MGQRLNIEIKRKDKLLANAYYHWSAYSKPSLELTKKIIEGFDKYIDESNDVIRAIKLLQETGAGITRTAIHHLYKTIEDFNVSSFQGNSLFGTCDYILARNRNDGLIEVSEEGMAENEGWEEGRMTIDIENKTFDFDVIWEVEDDELEEGENPPTYDIQLKNIPFEKIDEYIDIVDKIEKESNGHFKIGNKLYGLVW